MEWIRKQVEAAECRGIVVGMSGGVDSSTVAVLSKRAFPASTIGLLMPCYSDPQDLKDAKIIAEKFEIETRIVDLSSIYEKLIWTLEQKYCWEIQSDRNIAIANLKPRLRMIVLYYFANKYNFLVAGTGNRSELAVGYFTKYGDGGVDILPIGGLLKTEVKELASCLAIPKAIIDKPPSAGLWIGQTDEKEMGITYEQLDRYLSKRECNPRALKIIQEMMKKSEHKRSLPPYFKL